MRRRADPAATRRPAARRALVRRRRLAALAGIAAAAGAIALLSQLGDGQRSSSRRTASSRPRHPASLAVKLRTRLLPTRLPAPLSGEALARQGNALLAIGGLDAAATSSAMVLRYDPATASVARAGSLAEPVHDAAAATLGGRTLVFGGGAATTTDAVQSLGAAGSARAVGRLPVPLSDLSAVEAAGRLYVLGGYDGQKPSAAVLTTADGRRPKQVASLPLAVRYTAAAALGQTIYAFGGELASGQDSSAIQSVELAGRRSAVVGRLDHTLAHASPVVLGGRIYLLGGRLDGRPTARIGVFDPARDRVRPAGRLPLPVTNAAAGTVGPNAYLVGGLGVDATSPLSSIIRVARLTAP